MFGYCISNSRHPCIALEIQIPHYGLISLEILFFEDKLVAGLIFRPRSSVTEIGQMFKASPTKMRILIENHKNS